MGTAKRAYGSWSHAMLAALRDADVFKVDAFVSWLSERGVAIDRTLVSHWVAGRSHLPADALPLLAEFTGHPELVYGEFLRAAFYEPVHLGAVAPTEREITDQMLEVGATLGRLHRTVIDVRLPDSPGGSSITPGEKRILCEQLTALIHQLVELRTRLERP